MTTYHGYTVVQMIKNDLSCIENYIKNNKILLSYVGHIFNIWSNNLEKKWLKENLEINIEQPSQYDLFKKKYYQEIMSTDSRYYIKKDLFDELIYNIDKISQEISESSLSVLLDDKQLDNDVLQYELDKLNEFVLSKIKTRYMN